MESEEYENFLRNAKLLELLEKKSFRVVKSRKIIKKQQEIILNRN